MDKFKNANGKPVLMAMVQTIQQNKAYLGEVDGLIGDGDHGMNMNKGFTMFADRISDKDISFTDGLSGLGMLLFEEIGGSMGPIYGTVFSAMSSVGADEMGSEEIAVMLRTGLEELYDIVDARVGDKTLVDTLLPATQAMETAAAGNIPLSQALQSMASAAQSGRDSTKGLVAKYGRSARLGERSRDVLDAGAVSCCLILCAMADGIANQLYNY